MDIRLTAAGRIRNTAYFTWCQPLARAGFFQKSISAGSERNKDSISRTDLDLSLIQSMVFRENIRRELLRTDNEIQRGGFLVLEGRKYARSDSILRTSRPRGVPRVSRSSINDFNFLRIRRCVSSYEYPLTSPPSVKLFSIQFRLRESVSHFHLEVWRLIETRF